MSQVEPPLGADLRAAVRLLRRLIEAVIALGIALVFYIPTVYVAAISVCWMALASASTLASAAGLTADWPVQTMSLILAALLTPAGLIWLARRQD